MPSQNPGKHRQGRMFGDIVRTECYVLSVLSPSQSAPLGVPRSLFETRGCGGMQVHRGSSHPPTSEQHLRVFRNIVVTECHVRRVRMFWNIVRTECCVVTVLPPEVPQNKPVHQGSQPVTAAGRRLPRRCRRSCRRGQPSTPPHNTSQPP